MLDERRHKNHVARISLELIGNNNNEFVHC